VTTDELCGAIKSVYQATRSIVEPAGALGMAGVKRHITADGVTGRTLVAINSGANMNFERLRYVAERTQTGEERESLFAVTIPEAVGTLRRFCRDTLAGINITEFNYRLANRRKAQLFMGVSLGGKRERKAFSRRLKNSGYANLDLTDNELAKTHLRYMVGGRSPQAVRERIFRFWFPERPGALAAFLAAMGANWNISLFRYRTVGSEFGRVLMGLEIPDGDRKRFCRFLNKLGYRYVEETEDPAYRLFL
jgi:threonine dehydratase